MLTTQQNELFKRRINYYNMLLSLERYDASIFSRVEIDKRISELYKQRFYTEYNDEENS